MGRSMSVTGRSVSHRAVQCTRSQSVCIHHGTAGDFGMKRGLKEEERRGSLNATEHAGWSKTAPIYLPEQGVVVVPEGRDLDFGKVGRLDSRPLLLQPFPCPGLLGTPSLQPPPKKASFCCL